MYIIDRNQPATLADFLNRTTVRSGRVAAPISESLSCGCLPSRAARRSGRRGLTIESDGRVVHTRCGRVIGTVTQTSARPKVDWGMVLRENLAGGDPHSLALLAERHGLNWDD